MTNVEVTQLSYQLASGISLLHDIEFTAHAGEIIGLLGANGAGKTTLLKTLAGLIKPSAGQVVINGQDAHSLSSLSLASHIAYLEQQGQVAWPLTVEAVVALGRIPYGSSLYRLVGSDLDAVEQAISQCGIEYLRKRDVTTLSGGELARVLLARALAVDAPILLADEPIAMLDPHHQLHIMEVLKGYAEKGRLVITALHDLTLAAQYCTRLLVLSHGRLIADDTPEKLFSGEAIGKSYGIQAQRVMIEGKPYIAILAHTPEGCHD